MLTPEQLIQYKQKYGFGVGPQLQEVQSKQGFFEDAKQDIKQTGQNLKTTLTTASKNVDEAFGATKRGEINPIRAAGQALGTTAGAVPKLIGNVIAGGVKATLPQGGEDAIKSGIGAVAKPVMDTPFVQKLVKSYEALDSNKKRDVDALLGVADFALAPVVGRGTGAVADQGVKVATEGAEATARIGGRVLKGAGEAAYGTTIIPEPATKIATQAYKAKQGSGLKRFQNFFTGESVGEKPITETNTAARMGMWGTEEQLGIRAKQLTDEIWKTEIAPKLDTIKGRVNMKTFFGELEKEVRKTTPELGRRNSLLEAVQAMKEDFKNVNNISLTKLQEYKEGWAKFLPDATYKGKPIGAALKEVQNLAARKSRQIIYKYIGEEGKQAYLDYGNLQSIIQAGLRAGGDPAKKSLSRNVWEFVMDKALTPVATTGGKILYKTGEGLEIIGKKGAKKIKDLVDD